MGPPLPEVPIALQCQAALGFLNKDEDEGASILLDSSKPPIALTHVADGETEAQRAQHR